jgi:hypothetical protein
MLQPELRKTIARLDSTVGTRKAGCHLHMFYWSENKLRSMGTMLLRFVHVGRPVSIVDNFILWEEILHKIECAHKSHVRLRKE